MDMSRDHSSYTETGIDADQALRSFFGRVYLKVAVGLAMSAAIAWALAYAPVVRAVFFTPFNGARYGLTTAGWVLLVSPLVAMFPANFLVRDPIGAAAGPVFWLVAASMAGSMSTLALVLTGAGLVSTFLVAAVTFAALVVWGFATHQNLRGLGSFGSIALFGFILALAVNLFFGSPPIYLLLNVLGLLLFAALAGSDTKRLYAIHSDSPGPAYRGAVSSFGALSLYLNAVNVVLIFVSFRKSRSRN
ncbi:MAG: Bax inhibitor-1 family protein [Alphaproteobacteria bacterium]